MIVSKSLETWRSDRTAQRRVAEQAASVRTAWHDGPTYQRFDRALAPLHGADAVTIANAAASLFADDRWVDTLIAQLADAMRDDPLLEPPFPAARSDIHSGLVVYQSDHVSISAGLCRVAQLAAKKHKRTGPASIHFPGHVSVFKFVTAGDAVLSFWEAPAIGPDFSAGDAGHCRLASRREIVDGETIIIDGRHQSYVIEHACANMVVIQAAIAAERAPVSVEYDADSCADVGCNATDDGSSRIQMMSTLVRKLGHDDAVAVLTGFLDHPNFFVRWHVMRELLGIDVRRSLPHLRLMAAADAHPEARAAARRVLDIIENPPVRKAA